jgi:hypothetical protein
MRTDRERLTDLERTEQQLQGPEGFKLSGFFHFQA